MTDPLSAVLGQFGIETKPFSVTAVRNQGGRVVLVVTGDIDARTVEKLDHYLTCSPEPGTTAIVLDLSQVSFCSLSGIRVVADLLERATGAGIRLEVVVRDRVVSGALTCVGLFDATSSRADEAWAPATLVPSVERLEDDQSDLLRHNAG